jgi:hypothetical protein
LNSLNLWSEIMIKYYERTAKTKEQTNRKVNDKLTQKTYSYEEQVISQEDNCGQRYQRWRRSRK